MDKNPTQNDDIDDLVHETGELFQKTFGPTPLPERIADIVKEATELSRFDSISGLRSEAGDLLASLFALLHESGFKARELLDENRKKIEGRAEQYSKLGRKYKVAILGGAFDPITIGHIALAKHVLSTGHFDRVWLMPCGDHMDGKKMASAEHRTKMCQIAAAVDKRLMVSTYEIDKKLAGETYYLVKRLLGEEFAKREYTFSMIIGMDNANSFDKWVNYEYLERMIPFVVVPRTGTTPKAGVNWYRHQPHLVLDEPAKPIDISSTIVRKIVEGRSKMSINDLLASTKEYLDEKVLQYVIENNLYL